MKYAKKILGGEGDRDIDGLISKLKKNSPAIITGLELGGGRIDGKAMADDHSKKQVDPNSARTTQVKKIC